MNDESSRTGIYITFNNVIEIGPCNSLMAKLSEIAFNQPMATVHLLINSTGGSLASGLGLFNFLQLIPLDIVSVNFGYVGSIANLVFLASRKRMALPDSQFFFHDFTWTSGAETIPQSVITERSVQIDAFKACFVKALKERTQVFDGSGQPFDPFKPSIMDSRAAAAVGIATEHALVIPATMQMAWVI